MSGNFKGKKKKDFKPKGGFKPKESKSYHGSPVVVGPQNYTLVICNYPLGRSVDAVLSVLKTLTFTNFGAYPSFSNVKENDDRKWFMVSVLNHIQFEALLQLNGILVYNYPLWITSYPYNDKLAGHYSIFTNIFLSSAADGQIDLSDFKLKVTANLGDPTIVNFNNREFVEYLLFRLGVDSRDRQFWVSSLILCNNDIKAIAPWTSFFHFLPNLKYINLNNNPLIEKPILPPYLERQIAIDYNGVLYTSTFPNTAIPAQQNYPTTDDVIDAPLVDVEVH